MRSSQQQLIDELHELYKIMTDPEEQEKQRLKKQRLENIREMESDYGPI